MARIKRGLVSKRRHNKLLESTKGYRGTKSKLVKVAQEAALHAGQYAFHGRKRRKRDMRRLWIARIGEAAKAQGISYNQFVFALSQKNIKLNRKILAHLVTEEPEIFKQVVDKVKTA